MLRLLLLLPLLALSRVAAQSPQISPDDLDWVNLRTALPNAAIELRYASSNNIAHRPIYRANMQPLLRAGVARKLSIVEAILHRYNYRLKIWDAYRPRDAQTQLWNAAPKNDYVVNPLAGSGSMHAWGVAVDATIVDDWGRPVAMPTDFDDFSPAAMLRYSGDDPMVRTHLYLLQQAMAYADFYGLRTEWWHFTTSDWKRYVPERLAKIAGTVFVSP